MKFIKFYVFNLIVQKWRYELQNYSPYVKPILTNDCQNITIPQVPIFKNGAAPKVLILR